MDESEIRPFLCSNYYYQKEGLFSSVGFTEFWQKVSQVSYPAWRQQSECR